MEPLELFAPLDFLLEWEEDRLDFSELESLLDDLRSDLVELLPLESFDDRCEELRSFELWLELVPTADVEDLAPVSPDDLLGLRSTVFPEARLLVSPDASVFVLSEVVALDVPVDGLCRLSEFSDLPESLEASGRWCAVPADGELCCSAGPLVEVPRSGADGPCWGARSEVEGLVGVSAGRSAWSEGAVTIRPWASTSWVTWMWPTVLASSWTAAATGSVAACPPSAAAPASEPTVSTAPVTLASLRRGALE